MILKVFQKLKSCASSSSRGTFYFYSDDEKRLTTEEKKRNFIFNGAVLLEKQIVSFGGKGKEPIKIYSEEEICRATDGYDPAMIIGCNVAIVYKGNLEDRVVAIKTPEGLQVSYNQIDFFLNQVTIKQQIVHKNVVHLYGCCLETRIPMVVNEFMYTNLFVQLHGPSRFWISWKTRLRIATEIAYALSYMHCAAFKPIVHRNVKSQSIFLNESYTAKLSNFGMSVSINRDDLKPTWPPMGSLGYIDPEYLETLLVTEKLDVFSFGVVLVELIIGKDPAKMYTQGGDIVEHFISHIMQNRVLEIVDPRLLQESLKANTIHEFSALTMSCVQREGASRPTMEEVTLELQHIQKLLDLGTVVE